MRSDRPATNGRSSNAEGCVCRFDGKTRVELLDQLGFNPESATYRLDVKAAGLPAGEYRLYVEVAGRSGSPFRGVPDEVERASSGARV
jgi:hypothetical protein